MIWVVLIFFNYASTITLRDWTFSFTYFCTHHGCSDLRSSSFLHSLLCVCISVLGCGPGSVIHVYEHGWNLYQLPVRPGPAPSLPGDAEVCGSQAAPRDGKPKTGTNWKGHMPWLSPSQSLNYMELFPPQAHSDLQVFFQSFCHGIPESKILGWPKSSFGCFHTLLWK